jgi:NifU-like protein involved in Fe-S cluster formation
VKGSVEGTLPVYREKIREALQSSTHGGELSASNGQLLLHSSTQGVTLMVLIDPSTHTVKKTSFNGAGSEIQRGLLEVFCRICEGKPIQECSDHAGILLEFELRDHRQTRPVSGIVMPENTNPDFNIPIQLIREIFSSYKIKTQYHPGWNFFHPSPSTQWKNLSEDERTQSLRRALETGCRELNLPESAVELVSLDHTVRVTLRFSNGFSGVQKQETLMHLERGLKERV